MVNSFQGGLRTHRNYHTFARRTDQNLARHNLGENTLGIWPGTIYLIQFFSESAAS